MGSSSPDSPRLADQKTGGSDSGSDGRWWKCLLLGLGLAAGGFAAQSWFAQPDDQQENKTTAAAPRRSAPASTPGEAVGTGAGSAEALKRVLSNKDPETLADASSFALTLRDQGKFAEAESLQQEVLAVQTQVQVLGPNHPTTIDTAHDHLAVTLSKQGKYAEAEPLQWAVFEARKQVLGSEHPATVTAAGNLLHTLKQQGKSTKGM